MARVLVVDDDWAIVRALSDTFESMGHDVVSCVDALDAIAQLDVRAPDVIVADWQMGELGGLDVLEAALQQCPSARRVLITASPTAPEVRDAVRFGLAQLLVEKPWTFADLRGVVLGLT